MRRVMLVFASALIAANGQAAPKSPAPPAPVNLLTATPAIVAVSSTVANSSILPEHLVDGNLGTAWNSRTNELQGAWIGVRIPADARVTKIRMTVGFTKLDPKLGDLFTMNPRIRKVRVFRNQVQLVERTLDPEVRALQDIPIDQPGGDYKIEVIDLVPGKKTSWREVAVSELEIWGMPGASALAKPRAPVVRIGSFDPGPAISPDDCIAAAFPAAKGTTVRLQHGPEEIGNVEVFMLGSELAVCRIEHARERTERVEDGSTPVPGEEPTYVTTETTIDLVPVARTPRLRAGAVLIAATNTDVRAINTGYCGDSTTHTVALTVLPLSATENALLVDVRAETNGPSSYDSQTQTLVSPHAVTTTSMLYRVSPSRLSPVLAYDWEREQCRFAPAKPRPGTPSPLVRTCEDAGPPARRTTARYVWRDGAYELE